MNTIFKLYFQAWTLLSVGGSYAVYAVWRRVPFRLGAVWAMVAAALVVAGLVYPASAIYTRTRRPVDQELTLDGLLWWRTYQPDDLAVVRWMRDNIEGDPNIVEASGGAYEHNGRISMATGFPTILGWQGHEHQWRGTMDEAEPRRADVEMIYTTRSESEFSELLDKYDVKYVVIGDLERGKYRLTDSDVERLRSWLTPVYESGNTQLLERR
jgi:uncharacterized membrane protein